MLPNRILRAGQKVRQQLGKDRSGNSDGPLHDLPDWTFAGMDFLVLGTESCVVDGRPAPETAKQALWKQRREYASEKLKDLLEKVNVPV